MSFKPWADGPFPLISASISGDNVEKPVQGARKLAAEMTLVHNLILRGINAIYNQAINVGARGTGKDKLDFANFAYQWGAMLSEHHDTEEKMVFPEIEKITEVRGLMGDSVAEHHAFHDGLTQYMEYLDKVRSGNDTYDGEKLKAIIDSFAPVMQEHLVHEIESLVKLTDHEDKCDWAAWFKKTVDAIVSKDMKDSEFRTNTFPLTMVLHDKTFEGGVWSSFPPVPWLILWVMRYLFMNTRKDWWRFAPCDYSSQPQELPFAS
ncbi:Hemerythrin domain-containing protein [Fusarium falciforme]|uniref:Hemerythrin domain-containing protein n=1 Tax=Fusarium falciforme TaxID=195108 RepID=UPI0023007FB2|nr:Hemerythrin domain-containing protein [Fusarium falciforme]WAO85512.1 Hemerythrin domain-containing protein [Fusarium falciforme]